MSKVSFIGLDFDGVIVDHTANKIKAAKELGVVLAVSDTPGDILKKKLEYGLYRKLQHMIYDDPSFALSVPLVAGVAQGLQRLKKSGVPFALISRQRDPATALKNLKAHGLWGRHFSEENVFFVPDTAGKEQKSAELGVSAYLDDQPSVLAGLSVSDKFLLDPLRAYPPDGPYKQVASWDEFLSTLEI